ncbi:hypothetical protein PI87_21855 [Ralstonia sp. A12]|uniref:hypothetical protein n=1 Tax=Ralstonia sp. A12 TaxID=1217052 RepID=UPI000575755B|nr:hypothetical protein [Ralstonia sp. A12]KHK51021.1 hypothetical protein PI87_21855 [Ralstonia sp. A12]
MPAPGSVEAEEMIQELLAQPGEIAFAALHADEQRVIPDADRSVFDASPSPGLVEAAEMIQELLAQPGEIAFAALHAGKRPVIPDADRSAIRKFIESACAGQSNKGTVSAYASALTAFSAWLYSQGKPAMADRLREARLATDIDTFIQQGGCPRTRAAVKQLHQAVTWARLGAISIPARKLPDIPARDERLLIQFKAWAKAGNNKPRTVTDYTRALVRFSAALAQQGKEGLATRPLSPRLDREIAQLAPDKRDLASPALRHLRQMVNHSDASPFALHKSKDPIPGADAQLICQYREAAKGGGAAERTANRYAAGQHQFSRWLHEQGKEGLAVRPGSPRLDDDMSTFIEGGGNKVNRAALMHLRKVLLGQAPVKTNRRRKRRAPEASTSGTPPADAPAQQRARLEKENGKGKGTLRQRSVPEADAKLIEQYRNAAKQASHNKNTVYFYVRQLRDFSDWLAKQDKAGLAVRPGSSSLNEDMSAFIAGGGSTKSRGALKNLRRMLKIDAPPPEPETDTGSMSHHHATETATETLLDATQIAAALPCLRDHPPPQGTLPAVHMPAQAGVIEAETLGGQRRLPL